MARVPSAFHQLVAFEAVLYSRQSVLYSVYWPELEHASLESISLTYGIVMIMIGVKDPIAPECYVWVIFKRFVCCSPTLLANILRTCSLFTKIRVTVHGSYTFRGKQRSCFPYAKWRTVKSLIFIRVHDPSVRPCRSHVYARVYELSRLRR